MDWILKKQLKNYLKSNEKICGKCNSNKDILEFSRNKSKKDGHNSWCKTCCKNHWLKNKEENTNKRKAYYIKNRQAFVDRYKKYSKNNKQEISDRSFSKRRTITGIARELLHGAERRAKKNSLEFSIDVEYVKLLLENTPICPITKSSFVVGEGAIKDNSRTLDRIIPEKGYTKDNVVIVSNLANRVKNNATLEEIKLLYTNLYKVVSLCGTWEDKFKLIGAEEQKFQGWYTRKSGKRVSWHSHKISSMLRDAKKRSKNKDLICTISRKDIIIPEICPLLEIPIIPGKGVTINSSPTMDRIIPEKGYTPENIQIISHKANVMKNNCTASEIEKIYTGYMSLLL